MKRIALSIFLTIIILLIVSPMTSAQEGFPQLWQIPFFFGQNVQQFGLQQQYLPQWTGQTFLTGNMGSYNPFNLFQNSLASKQRYSSGSSSQFFSNMASVYSPSNSGQYYIPSNQTQYGSNASPVWNPLYQRVASGSDSEIPPGLPLLSQISYNAGTGLFYAPQLSHWDSGPKYFTPGAVFFSTDVTGRAWSLDFFLTGPSLYSNGTLITGEGTTQIMTITIEDDGKTFTFKPGELFRVALPMYDEISNEDFSMVAGWEEEGRAQWSPATIDFYGFEPKQMGLHEDDDGNLVQENTYRALKQTPNSTKELVFNYHGPSGRNDTFRVTISIQGPGSYAPSY